MKKLPLILSLLFLFVLNSCLNLNEQSYLKDEIINVEKIEFYNYRIDVSMSTNDLNRIDWYTDFFNDSTNYFKIEQIDLRESENIEFKLKFISKVDTLDLHIYSIENSEKVIVAFLDPYDSDKKMKFRKYNRFYINKTIADSISSNWD